MDIENSSNDYLKQIYDRDGKIKINEDPSVSYINKIDLIYNLDDELINLLVYQRIIGVNDINILGNINSVISLKNNEINILDKYITSNGKNISSMTRINDIKEEIENQIPKDAIFINFNKFGGTNG